MNLNILIDVFFFFFIRKFCLKYDEEFNQS